MKQIGILIPTLPARIDSYHKLITELNRQVVEADLEDQVQIVSMCDTKDYTVGRKRNYLLHLSLTRYVCFIDDDDWISNDYIKDLYKASLSMKDCVTFKGQYIADSVNRIFDMSMYFGQNRNTEGCYYRLPNHLSLVKREIALKCLFPNKQYGEDDEYSLRLKKHLKTEEKINKVLYFYMYDEEKSQTNPNSKASQFNKKK